MSNTSYDEENDPYYNPDDELQNLLNVLEDDDSKDYEDYDDYDEDYEGNPQRQG